MKLLSIFTFAIYAIILGGAISCSFGINPALTILPLFAGSFIIKAPSGSALSILSCPDSCSDELAKVSFSDCAGVYNQGGIWRIYLTNIGYPFPDPNVLGQAGALAAWNARLSNSSTNPNAIRCLTIVGSKPVPGKNELTVAEEKKIYMAKDHSIPFKIDQVSDENYDFMRSTECGGSKLMVYEGGNYLYGGKTFGEGIECTITLDDTHPESSKELNVLEGVITWSSKQSPDRVANFIR